MSFEKTAVRNGRSLAAGSRREKGMVGRLLGALVIIRENVLIL